MKRILISTILSLALVVSLSASVYADNEAEPVEKETITKTFDFNAVDEDDLEYPLEETITENGKEYTLVDTDYEVTGDYKQDKLTRVIEVENKDDLEKEIIKDGVKYTCKEPKKWEEVKTGEKTTTETMNYASMDEIPSSINIDGNTYNYNSAELQSFDEAFSTTTTFTTTDLESPYFIFNGEQVRLDEDEPTWSGWKSAVENYLLTLDNGALGVSDFTVDDISWSGDFVEVEDGVYVREAVINGSVRGSYYQAAFDNVQTGINTVYRATVDYLAPNPEGYTVTAKVTAVYEEVLPEIVEVADDSLSLSWFRKHLKEVIIAACAAIVVIAALISIILAILKKKKKEEEEKATA